MLTASELADLAGCDEERVGRLVEAGYLAPVGERFSASDVPRIRLAEAFERAGITVEDIVRGIEAGALQDGSFHALHPVALKGVAEPVSLHRALRS